MRYVFILLLLVFVMGAVQAADTTQQAKISLDLANLDVAQAFEKLSQASQITILGDSTVKGNVTCNLSDVTVDQALDIICKMNKLVWVKVYTSSSGDEKLSASKLFKLLDALKELGGSAVICENAAAGTQTVFVPGAKAGAVNAGSVAENLNLKPVYLVRAEPDPAAEAEKEKQGQTANQVTLAAASDPQAAAQNVWNYFSQMPIEQGFQAMEELRRMFFQSMTPDQMRQMHDMYGGQHGNNGGGHHGGQGGNGGQPQPAPGQ